jgi:hypothetical protein
MIPSNGQRPRSAVPQNRQMASQRRPGPPDPYPPPSSQQQYIPPPSSQQAYRQQALSTQYEDDDEAFPESQRPQVPEYRPTPPYYPSPTTPMTSAPPRRHRDPYPETPQQPHRRHMEAYTENGTPRSTPSVRRPPSVAPSEHGKGTASTQLLALYNGGFGGRPH